jgi:hypothetical protein
MFNVKRYALNGEAAEEDAYRMQALRQGIVPRTAQDLFFLRIWKKQ